MVTIFPLYKNDQAQGSFGLNGGEEGEETDTAHISENHGRRLPGGKFVIYLLTAIYYNEYRAHRKGRIVWQTTYLAAEEAEAIFIRTFMM